LQYPIGWRSANWGWPWFFQYVLGSIITAIAISMGSSFWFDALQKHAQDSACWTEAWRSMRLCPRDL